MKTDWTYNGDIDLRHGGFYWKPLYDDRVEAVDVFSYPEDEDNIFRLVSDSIYMPREKYDTALDTCGYRWVEGTIVDCLGEVHTDPLPLLVDAFKAYWGLNDTSQVFKIQIGGPKNHPNAGFPSGPPELYDYRIAHNASLRKFVEREFL